MAKRTIAPAPVLPGYAYVRPLGSGGFADVYLFQQDLPSRVVAVKALIADAITPAIRQTFNSEADTLAALSSHPSIVTLYGASISADGRPYFVMEYCPDSMRERYRRGPRPTDEVLDIGVRIGGALETAHRARLLHRDIKPSNILVTARNTPVLADFGVAITQVMGANAEFAMSIPWTAPEVIRRETLGTPQSEVWALGATLYTLLAARTPFETANRERNGRDDVTARILAAKHTPINRPDVPVALGRVLAVSMARNPADRYPTMAALAQALQAVQQQLGLALSPLDVDTVTPVDAPRPETGPRGPVISVVNPESRRAGRTAAADADPAGPTQFRKPRKRVRLGLLVTLTGVGGLVVGFALCAVLHAAGVL